jgi:putative transposase
MERHLPVSLVCRVLGAPRSTLYARRRVGGPPGRPGPMPPIGDQELVRLIRRVLADSRFAGEATARSAPVWVASMACGSAASGCCGCSAARAAGPTTSPWTAPAAAHDGTSIPDRPNVCWGTDATMAWTRTDGWVWGFAVVDHSTAEAWAQVAKIGDRFAALEPVYDAVIDRWGRLDADVARGVQLRHDWGPQYRSGYFLGSIAWLGIADDAAFLGEPETNGCAERWIRTLKDQCLWAELHDGVDQLRQAVAGFVHTDNTQWLIGRHGHRTPKEAYQDATTTAAA